MHQQNGNILLVGSNKASLTALREEILPYFNVFTAPDSQTAFQILWEYSIHVVLAGDRLPDMTGIQFFESIRQEFPDVVSIVQATEPNNKILKAAARSGKIQMFLRRNAELDEIIQILSTAVNHYQLKKENSSLNHKLIRKASEQERILEVFNRYVPEQVVSQNLSNNDNNLLQGETRVISVLFADIRGFSRIAGSLTPSDVVKFLNEFWSIVSKPVNLNHGSVNKFIGDGILALFGAPISHMRNQKNAVNCALDMIDALGEFNKKYEPLLGQKVEIGIGINTGEVVVGNVGTNDHIEYTVIGDVVNTASKIESKTKSAPNSILISEATYNHVKDLVDVDEISALQMAGKDDPVRLFRVEGRKSQGNINPIRKNLEI